MENPTIGIKIANGTYFPILGENDRNKKRLVLTPTREEQSSASIQFYRGDGDGMFDPEYLASITLLGIIPDDEEKAAENKIPDIELIIGVNDEGILDAEAYEPISGARESCSVKLEPQTESAPTKKVSEKSASTKTKISESSKLDFTDLNDDFSFDDKKGEKKLAASLKEYDFSFDDSDETSFDTSFNTTSDLEAEFDDADGSSGLKNGIEESDNFVSEEVEEQEEVTLKTKDSGSKNKLLKIAAIALIIIFLLLLGFLAYILFFRPKTADAGKEAAQPVVVVEQPKPVEPKVEQPPAKVEEKPAEEKPLVTETPAQSTALPQKPVEQPKIEKPDQSAQKKSNVSAKDVKYRIKWGDTLWNISNTYYRTPWLYKKIAKDNKIKNPDKIYAGNMLTIKAEK